jgi:hypothetical protein
MSAVGLPFRDPGAQRVDEGNGGRSFAAGRSRRDRIGLAHRNNSLGSISTEPYSRERWIR